jgi:hypothetical protein
MRASRWGNERPRSPARWAGPFREQPPIQLGPLEVGLEVAAVDACRRIPAGGRLVTLRSARLSCHAAGALGSAGVLSLAIVAVVAGASRWAPADGIDLLLCFAAVLFGGLSLATVLRAVDRRAGHLTTSAHVVGGRARGVIVSLARLGASARANPSRFGGRRVGALTSALDAARDPEIARWIPADLRGRGELLLARALPVGEGAGWSSNHAVRERVRMLLEDAARHLDDPAPAEADLALLPDATPVERARLDARLLAEAEAEGDAEDVALAAHGQRVFDPLTTR